jgi:hypothetical protein
MKDKYIGTIGTEEREKYEYELLKTLSQTTKKALSIIIQEGF